MMVQNQSHLGEGSVIPTNPHHTPTFIQPSTQPQKTQQHRNPKRKDTRVPQPSDPTKNVVDKAVHKELGNSLVRVATTTSSLEVKQDSGNINKTQFKASPNESSSPETNSGGGPRCQETMGDTIAQTSFHDGNVSAGEEVYVAEQEVTEEVVGVINTAKLIVDAAQDSDATIVSTATTTTATIKTVNDITLAQALEEMKTTKPKKKGVVIQELG
ncbi:hypothetical protein Tco_0022685, partial [Tanacetum coccineum]